MCQQEGFRDNVINVAKKIVVREVIDSSRELTNVAFLNSHVVKLFFKFKCIYIFEQPPTLIKESYHSRYCAQCREVPLFKVVIMITCDYSIKFRICIPLYQFSVLRLHFKRGDIKEARDVQEFCEMLSSQYSMITAHITSEHLPVNDLIMD